MHKQEYINGILSGDRVILGKAITLTESTLDSDQLLAEEILEACMSEKRSSHRIAISGSPGVGKSTFIEKLGLSYVEQGSKVAVLAIDPSSQSSGGSILGDRTRMEKLSASDHAFIRPSPAAEQLGGVAGKTRETILLCEAAGFDKVIVETVGVGQSEIAASKMTDVFLLLVLAGAGDELQGIKRGIMELADFVIVNKADGDNIKNATKARRSYVNAIHMFPPKENGEKVEVLAVSSINGDGFDDLISKLEAFFTNTEKSGALQKDRRSQQKDWLEDAIKSEIAKKYSALNKKEIADLLEQISEGKMHPAKAARMLLKK
ncbi:MAG: methylmalonyl Co-A mutase-associated GTPase MeaB [Flavobacteriales bacterium]|nr:methylmalonyl Co-A mutase-associated GTPase MeaB [Flavobacteriales bacterium]